MPKQMVKTFHNQVLRSLSIRKWFMLLGRIDILENSTEISKKQNEMWKLHSPKYVSQAVIKSYLLVFVTRTNTLGQFDATNIHLLGHLLVQMLSTKPMMKEVLRR